MNKLYIILLSILICSTLLYIYIFFIYLIKEYRKAASRYQEQKQRTKKVYIITKEMSKKDAIKNNVTELLDSSAINSQVGYADLEFLDEKGKITRTFKIRKKLFKLGRDNTNDLILHDSKVSKNHCLIKCQDKRFLICNQSDVNPIMLNGIVIKGTSEIKYGDIVDIGNTTFRFADIIKKKKIV